MTGFGGKPLFSKRLEHPRAAHHGFEQLVGFIVSDELLGLGVPLELTSDFHCDQVEMTDRRGAVTDLSMRKGLLAALDALDELLAVATSGPVRQARAAE